MAKQVAFKPILPNPPRKTLSIPALNNFIPRRNIIITKARTSGGTTTVYTVPAGKMFILIATYLTCRTTNAGGASANYIYIDRDTSSTRLVEASLPLPAAGTTAEGHTSLNFGEGFRFGDGVTFVLSTDFNATCGLYGYEIDQKDLEYYERNF